MSEPEPKYLGMTEKEIHLFLTGSQPGSMRHEQAKAALSLLAADRSAGRSERAADSSKQSAALARAAAIVGIIAAVLSTAFLIIDHL